jgi:hypothetical protein
MWPIEHSERDLRIYLQGRVEDARLRGREGPPRKLIHPKDWPGQTSPRRSKQPPVPRRVDFDPYQHVDSLVRASGDRLVKWYPDSWLKMIIWCLECTKTGSEESEQVAFWLQLQHKYIMTLIKAKPAREVFRGHGYKYDLASLPYRDHIVHPWNVYLIGKKMLEEEAPAGANNGKTGLTLLWDRIASNRNQACQLVESLLDQRLSDVSYEDRREILLEAWYIAAHCHDLGRIDVRTAFAEDLRMVAEVWHKRLAIPETVADAYVASTIQGISSWGAECADHGVPSCDYLCRELSKLSGPLQPSRHASVVMALEAIREHNKLLVDVDKDDSQYVGGLSQSETWASNPLGAFLALVILLEETVVRLCWYNGDRCLEPGVQPHSVMLVTDFSLDLRPGAEPMAVYGIKSLPHFEQLVGNAKTLPQNENKRRRLAEALGPDCFGLAPQGIKILSQEWDLPHRVGGSQDLRPREREVTPPGVPSAEALIANYMTHERNEYRLVKEKVPWGENSGPRPGQTWRAGGDKWVLVWIEEALTRQLIRTRTESAEANYTDETRITEIILVMPQSIPAELKKTTRESKRIEVTLLDPEGSYPLK